MKNLFVFVVMVLIFFSCRKENFSSDTNLRLSTSVDTLHFDTVFTTTGSVSQYFKIANSNNKGIRLSSVRLAGGASSPFKINVDGVVGPQVGNAEVLANDSIYVYVTVNINPSAQNLPFIVKDSVEISYNGNTKWVQLDAFGQNAHFFRNRKITASETWNNDLPYVILGSLTVDTTGLLTITKGCKIYMHADAPFLVNGSLQAIGEKFDSTRIVFTGDRLDEPYKNFPASFPGLIFTNSSKNNTLTYCTIKNSYQGVVITNPSSAGTKLSLNQTIIDNAYDAGILALNTSITANNVLVSNCGKGVILAQGGNYNFTHVTVASYSNSFIQHKDPVLVLTNFIAQGTTAFVSDLNASFTNCIFWGEQNGFVTNEVQAAKQGNTAFNVNFNKVLWRVQSTPANVTLTSPALNQPPLFDSINTAERFYNFRLKNVSSAKNAGILTGLTIDLDGNPRAVGLPDLGAYEKQ